MPLLNKPQVSSANFQRTEQEIASLQREIAAQQQQTSASSAPAPSVPLPCTGGTFEGSGGFVIAAQVDKKGEFDTFCAMIPAGCTRLGTLIGKTSDQAIRDNTLFHWVDVPDDIAATGGHFEYMFPLNLKYNTQYGLIQLIAVVEDPVTGLTGRKKNPSKPWNGSQYNYLNNITWTTGNALNAPATPICNLDPTGLTGDIIENTIYVDHDGGHARLTLRAYFAANRTSTAAQMEATKIGVRLKPVAGGALIQASAVVNNDSDKFEDITISDLPEGAQFLWQDVWTKHGTGRAFSAVANCAITAGGVNIDPTAFATMVNGATLSFAAVDAKHSLATLTYTQPSPPFAIKKIQILRSDTGAGGPFNVEVPADRPIAEAQTSPGTQMAKYLVKTRVANSGLWKVRMLARPGLDVTGNTAFTSTGVADATGDLGPAGPVQNFTATWEASNVTFKWKLPVSNSTSIVNYNVWATDLTNTQFMQLLSDGTTRAGQHSATQSKQACLVQSGHHITTKIKLRAMDAPFNTGFTIHVTANNYVNGVLTEGQESTFNVTPGVDYLNATDGVNVVSPTTLFIGVLNEVTNGDFHRSRAQGRAKGWTVGIGGGFIPPAPDPGGLEFDVINHWAHWFAFVPGPTQKLGDPGLSTNLFCINLSPGDYKTVGLRMWSLNGPHTLTFNLILRSDVGVNAVVIPFTVALTTQAQLVQVVLQVPAPTPPATPFGAGAVAVYLLLTNNDGLISGVNDVLIDGIGMNAGQTFTSFTSHPQVETNQNGAEAYDAAALTTSAGTSPINAVNPTGPIIGGVTQGGAKIVGTGGVIPITTL